LRSTSELGPDDVAANYFAA